MSTVVKKKNPVNIIIRVRRVLLPKNNIIVILSVVAAPQFCQTWIFGRGKWRGIEYIFTFWRFAKINVYNMLLVAVFFFLVSLWNKFNSPNVSTPYLHLAPIKFLTVRAHTNHTLPKSIGKPNQRKNKKR